MAISVITGGASKTSKRVKDDFYATHPDSVKALLDNSDILHKVHTILEPCVGAGHIAKVVKEYKPLVEIDGIDIVNRGYENTKIANFLEYKCDKHYDLIITNPPYKNVLQFVQKSLTCADTVAMFLKLTFLESQGRKDFFIKNKQLKYVYVFSSRQKVLLDGDELSSNAIAYAWFVWEKAYRGDPQIKWL